MKLKFFYFLCSLSFLLFSKLSIAQDRCSDLFKDSQSTHKIVQNKRGGKKKDFQSYQKAQQIAQSAGIKSAREYQAQYKKLGLPSNPDKFYQGEWQSWGHFLGTKDRRGRKKKIFPSYQETQQIAQNAGIKTKEEYKAQYKKLGLPSNPDITYKEEWQGYGHFLGTGEGKKKNFPSFQEALQRTQDAGIKTKEEYKAQYKKLGLPSTPHQTYKKEWQSWGHFLGTGRVWKKNFPSYQETQQIAQDAGIKTQKEYKAQYKKLGLPSTPHQTYKKEWQGYKHFLGTKFPSFQEALKRTQSAGIKSVREYQAQYKKLGLPSNPDITYKEEWQGYGHFLGTGRVRRMNFQSYQETQKIAQDAGIKTQKEYQAQYKKLGLPSRPDRTYKKEWQGYRHFLGTGEGKKKNFPSFQEALNIVQAADITSAKEYQTQYKKLGLPSRPDKVYQGEWESWGHFLGTGRVRRTNFQSYQETQQIAQDAGIKSVREYQAQYKKLGLPSNPDITYKEEWQGYEHFLGTGEGKKKNFPSFQEAQNIAQSAGIKTRKEYQTQYKKLGLPSRPDRIYKKEWQGYRYFLGTEFPSYQEALNIIQDAGIKNKEEYQAQYKKLGLPSNPHKTYKKEWQGYRYFLGTEFPSFQEALKIVQDAGIKTHKEYQAQYKKLGLPSRPDRTYKKEWQGYKHFLGTEFPSYQEALQRTQDAGIKTRKEYQTQYKKLGLPSTPHQTYKKEWQGYKHFLGTKFPSYQEALNIVQDAGIKNKEEYQAQYKKLGLPSNPHKTYKKEWQGYRYFLGTEFPSYQEALQRTQDAGIKTRQEYQAQYKKLGLPSTPHITYKGEWEGYRHFLGTEFPSFQEALKIVQDAGIKTHKEYKAQYKKLGLPSRPDRTYKKEWQGYEHFLGTKN